MDTLHHFGGKRAHLYANQGADQHPQRHRVEDVSVNRVLTDGSQTCREDDLQNIRAHCSHGGNSERVHKHREGCEPAASTHHGGKGPDKETANRKHHPGNSLTTGNEILIESYHRWNFYRLTFQSKHGGSRVFLAAATDFCAASMLQKIVKSIRTQQAQQKDI